jgi:SAM-dependent methyltransferase
LNIIHQIYLILLNGQLTITPIPLTVQRILDVGSGPGDWAVATGEQFPEAEIIATDISVFDSPMGTIAPPNVYFQIDDAEQEWTYQEPFDVIHARNLSHAITDWAEFYAQAYRHLVPGGTLYVADTNLTNRCLHVPNDSPNSYLHIFLSAVESAAESAKLPPGLDHMKPDVLAAAGFTNVRVFDRNVPIGTWPSDNRGKTLGKMGLIALLESLEALSLRLLTTYAGWTVEDVTDLCNQVKREIVTWQGATCTVRFAVATRPT